MIGYIYYISNTVNDKLYVGKTMSSLKERFKTHCKDSKRVYKEQRPLYRAMRKYGEDKFSIHLLEEAPEEHLAAREIFWIEKLGTYHYGYNATYGGEGKIRYNEESTKKFVRDYNRGMNVKEIAKKHKCDTDTVRKRLKSKGIDTTTNSNTQKTHKVAQYDKAGNVLHIFDSQKEAAQHLLDTGIGSNLWSVACHIGEAAKGSRESCMGYRWKFI